MAVKLAEVTRGEIVDCVHRGSIAVVESSGKLLHEVGDSGHVTFFRSSFKPLQAIVALEAGAAEKFGLDLKDIALIVSSHSGEEEHLKVIRCMMEKIGVNEEALECGVHEPHGKEATRELYKRGMSPTRLHCNCSGKHLGMMAAIKIKGLELERYSDMDHPIQKDVIKVISDFCNMAPGEIIRGVDGCGIPVYAIPLKNMALGYANLCDTEFHGGKYRKSQNYILSAMTMYPELVAGKNRFDTEIMKKFGDRLISKMGAEGVYCAGLTGKATGIAIKIEDGNSRAIGPVIMELLRRMGAISRDELEPVKDLWKPPIFNHREEKVGEIRAAFRV